MATYANAVYPVPNRFLNLGKEVSPGTIATGTYTFPMTTFKPVDKVTYLPDSAWRNAMGDLYNMIKGVRVSDVSCGGPLFADGIGYVLMDIMGDYWQFVNGTVGTFTSLNGATVVGAGTIVVASSTGITTNTIISIGGTGTTAEEVRKVTNVGAAGTLTLNANLYQAHGNAGTVFAYSAVTTYGHNFAQLNAGLGGGGWTASQPATYTYEDFSGVPLTTGARNYAYSCFSECSITSEATGLVMWDGKMTSLASAIASQTPTTSLTSVAPQAAWLSTVSLGGAGTANTAEWKVTLTRKVAPMFTNSGQQDPFAIVRGAFSAGLGFNFDPASDESEFLYYLNNTQPALSIVASNGLAGTAAASLTITANQAAFDTGELNDSKEVFGFDEAAKLVENTVNTGPSGGFGPCVITLTNNVINY